MEFIDLIISLGPRLIELSTTAANSQWSLVLLALLCWGDGFFPPLPAGTVVSALGAAAISTGNPTMLVAVIVIASTAALAGDMTMVAIGRHIPMEGNSRFSRLALTVTSRAEQHWTLLLSTSRFIPVLRVAVFLAAGSRRVPIRRILVLDGTTALVWACVYALAGGVGGSLTTHPLLGIVIGTGIGGLAGSLVGLVAQRLQLRSTRNADAAPDEGPRCAQDDARTCDPSDCTPSASVAPNAA